MILSFCEYMPWRDTLGKKIETKFKSKIQLGLKKHTFRRDRKNRWKEGVGIHLYLNLPRNGGVPFNMPFEKSEKWFFQKSGKNKSLKNTNIDLSSTPSFQDAIPILHGFETFKFRFIELGENGTMVSLNVEGVRVFEVTYNVIDDYLIYDRKLHYDQLCTISANDGLTYKEFLRWFIHLSRKYGRKEIQGKILHWTKHRYVKDIEADPFTESSKCPECFLGADQEELDMFGGMCEECNTDKFEMEM